MALNDFLNNGQIPAGSAVTSMTTESVVPPWYQNSAMDLLSNQMSLVNRPYEPAPMPRVADFTEEQKRGFGMTGTAATAYQPGLAAATEATKGVINAPGAMSAAQPYMTQAGQSTVANINQYMNPYTEQVVNRIAELGSRNLFENIMPGIEGRYIQAGQLGFGGRGGASTPSGMMTDTARAIRDTSSDILGKQAEALRGGWSEAAGLSAADLSRMGALATTAGNLAGTDLNRTLSGAEQLGGLAASEQALGLKGAEAVTGVGAQQQALNQKNLDVALADWLTQQGYPQEQINNAVQTFKSLGAAAPAATVQEGISPSGVPYKGEPSDLVTGLGTAAGVWGIIEKALEKYGP